MTKRLENDEPNNVSTGRYSYQTSLAFGESVRGPTSWKILEEYTCTFMDAPDNFNEIRKRWENERNRFDDSLFMLDGTMFTNQPPLACNIMQFLKYASTEGYTVHMLSQIKKGEFVDHLTHMSEFLSKNCVFLLKDYYIKRHIQGLPDIEIGKPGKQAFGEKYNWGVPMFHKDKNGNVMVLNIPNNIGRFKRNAKYTDLLGADNIFKTLPSITRKGNIVPVEMADDRALIPNRQAEFLMDFLENSSLAKTKIESTVR